MARKRRKNRKPLPQVGPRQAGELRLSPRLKSKLKKRSTAQARREAMPTIQALQSQRKFYRKQSQRAKKTYRRDVQSAKGAVAFGQKYIGKTSLKGLTGRDKQEVAKELAMTQRDIAASFPMMKQEARGALRETQAGIREDKDALAMDISEARATMMEDAAAKFRTERSGAVEEAQSAIKAQRQRRRDKREERQEGGAGSEEAKEKKEEAQQAKAVGKSLLKTASPKIKKGLLADDDEAWELLAQEIMAKEGVTSFKAARKAAQALRQSMFQRTNKGVSTTSMRERYGPSRPTPKKRR